MNSITRRILRALIVLSMVPTAWTFVGCTKDESKDVLQENINPEMEKAFRGSGRRQEIMEELEADKAAAAAKEGQTQ